MWIKRLSRKLYIHVLLCVVLAGALSLGFWYTSSSVLEYIAIRQYETNERENKLYYDTLVEELKAEIAEKNLTFWDIEEEDYDIESELIEEYREEFLRNPFTQDDKDEGLAIEGKAFEVYFVSATGSMFYPDEDINLLKDWYFESMYIYPVEFADGAGFVIINPQINKLISDIYEGTTVIVSILLFILITLWTIRKQFKYIEEIDREVLALSQGNLDHRIAVKGNNELTHLATTINEMSASLQEMMRKETQIERKQRTLITNISHDLRTPLTSTIGYLNMLTDKKYKDETEAQEFLEKAKQKSLQLQGLLNDLLSYAKLTNSDVPYHPINIDLYTFVLQYIETQELDVNVYTHTKETFVKVDTDWLYRIMDNLFDNIRKHATEGTAISLLLHREADKIIFRLQNEVAEDLTGKTEFLFDRMYVSNEARTDTSSGLGLAIVAESMEKMGGSATATFDEGIFQIVLTFESGKDAVKEKDQ